MIDEFLRCQDGVLTLVQARMAGLSQDAVNRRLRSGHWRRCAPGVYFVDDRPFTDAARIRAAVWGYGDFAAASGLAAAWWQGLTRFAPDLVEVTVPRNANGRRRPGSRVRRRDLLPADIIVERSLRLTALPLTAIEAAARRGGGAKLVDAALQRQVELRALWTAHLRNKGRYGSPASRRMLQAVEGGARSQAERLLVGLLKSAGMTNWRANFPLAGYRIDVAFPDSRVAIEVDGLAFHTDTETFHHDRLRQNAISLTGWQVLRFTWLDLTEYPERVVATIRRAISA